MARDNTSFGNQMEIMTLHSQQLQKARSQSEMLILASDRVINE